jgi:hypothetical protein
MKDAPIMISRINNTTINAKELPVSSPIKNTSSIYLKEYYTPQIKKPCWKER